MIYFTESILLWRLVTLWVLRQVKMEVKLRQNFANFQSPNPSIHGKHVCSSSSLTFFSVVPCHYSPFPSCSFSFSIYALISFLSSLSLTSITFLYALFDHISMSCLPPTFTSPHSLSVHLSSPLSLQSLDEDCTLEEEDEGLIEEEDEIDQFNDDTFGAGAIGALYIIYIWNLFTLYYCI